MNWIKSFVTVLLIAVECQGSRVNPLNGVHLKLPGFHYPPRLIMSKNEDGTTLYRGLAVDVMEWLKRRLNITYSFVVMNQTEMMTFGYATVLIEALVKKRVDILSSLIAISAERNRYMDVTFPLMIDSFRILVKTPEDESRLLAPVKPFQPMAWLSFLVSFLAVVLFLTLIQFYYDRRQSFWELLQHNWNYLLTIITNQGNCFMSMNLSLRLLAGTWCLMALVLTNSYAGCLRSFMTVPKMKPVPQSLEELALSTDFTVTVEKGAVIADSFLNAKSGHLKQLGSILRNDPTSLYATEKEAWTNLKTGKYALVLGESEARYYMSVDLDKTDKCNLVMSKPLNYFQAFGFGLPKNSPYNSIINNELQYLQQTGLFDKWKRQYRSIKLDRCLQAKEAQAEVKTLKFSEVASSFIVLGIGLVLSFIGFLYERFIGSRT